MLYLSGLDLHPDHRIYPVIFFSTVCCGKEGFSHNSVIDIKDMKQNTKLLFHQLSLKDCSISMQRRKVQVKFNL
jgi:hypothetical protein